jgi:hypothetical protein
MGRHVSAQHTKGQRSKLYWNWNWNWIRDGKRNWRGYGYERGLSALHVRHTPAYTQELLAVDPSSAQYGQFHRERRGKPNEYAETTRSPSCAENRQSSRCRHITAHITSPRPCTTMTTPTTPISASATIGFRDPLVRREESEARAKAAPPPPKVVTGRPRAPVGD